MRTPYWLLAGALAVGLGVLAPFGSAADKADAERIAKLVKQLGSDSFEEREQASKELEAIGTPALEALREAADKGDEEVKTRAAAILRNTEKKAVAEKALTPTKVKLTFKDTPLADALAEFSKKSGYTIQVHDPEEKLKDRTVTLDTGEVTFWEAFDKFCEKAGLVEATLQDALPLKAIGLPRGAGGPGGGILPPPAPIKPPKDFSVPPPAAGKDDPAPAPAPAEKKEGAAARVAVARVAVAVQVQAGGGAVGAPAAAVPPGGFGAASITVMDGKPQSVPTCYAGSVRIRALKEAPAGAADGKDEEHTVWLEVRPEPKTGLQSIQSVAVEKATDDQDQKLSTAAPPAPAAPGALPGGGLRPIAPAILRVAPAALGGVGGTQYHAVRLKKGEKEAKALKEFAGTISARVQAPAEALITADKISEAGGKTFKGRDGGQVKVIEVKEDDGTLTVKFEVEQPEGVVPTNPGGRGFLPGGVPGIVFPPDRAPPLVPLRPIRPAADPAPAAAPAGGAGFAFQVEAPQAPPALRKPAAFFMSAPGVTLVDDKGKTIEQSGGDPPTFRFVPGKGPNAEYSQEYKLEKGQKAAKLLYSGSKVLTIDIPFAFKDVPLNRYYRPKWRVFR